MHPVHPFQLRRAGQVLRTGGVVAYPTEAVYGLGCDPLDADAVHRLLALKGRAAAKGVILIAADLEQLGPYLAPVDAGARQRAEASWPGPVTWVWPARTGVPSWLSGGRDTLAVRVTDHAPAAALCEAFGGPLVSTSANRAGLPPARTPLEVRRAFPRGVDLIVHGPLGGRDRVSEIRDVRTGAVLRAG